MKENTKVAVELVGGPADGQFWTVESLRLHLTFPLMGGGEAVYKYNPFRKTTVALYNYIGVTRRESKIQ